MGALLTAVERDIERMNADVRDSALASLLRVLAEAVERKPSALMAHELRVTWDRLLELSPPKAEEDAVDELLARRRSRRA